MGSKLPNLSTELRERLFEALLSCEEFDSDVLLQEFIANGDLSAYHKWFLEHNYETKEERIENAVKYLIRQRLHKVKLALPLLLLMLHDTLIEGDALRDELEDLHNKLTFELQAFYQIPSSSSAMTEAIPSDPQGYHSASINYLKIETMEEISLASSDRRWIVTFVDSVIERLPSIARKNLLLDCGHSNRIINSISFGEGSGVVAEAMVDLIVSRDKPNSNVRYLGIFLRHLIEVDERRGDDVEAKVEAILLHYQNKVSENAKLPYFSKNVYQQHKNLFIYQSLQNATETFKSIPQVPAYKIDVSAIIQCNLDKQRTHFINGFHGHYKGFFTFAVASIDHDVLKNYVIESLIWELKQRTKRSTDVRHVYLYPEHFSSSSTEEGSLDLQTKLEKYFGIQSFDDLIEDNQDTDLVIVLWNMNIPLDDFKHVTLRFSQNLKEYAHHILQKRCLILFWANCGPVSMEPLELSTALPPFEQFEVEHVVEWLEAHLNSLQRSERLPEQVIKYCRERLIAKVNYHGGSLPGTYESLLEPLELGGLF